MYNPPRFKVENLAESLEFMGCFPFATLISVSQGQHFVSHLPLVPFERDGQIELIGHLARANPHSKLFAGSVCTAIFMGSHTYVTPKWYAKNDVPTWNYSVIHATGSVELIETEIGIVNCLRQLRDHVEKLWPSGWEFYIPEDLVGANKVKMIVGFKIAVSNIDFKKKLGQNRSKEDLAGVLAGLESRDDDNSRGVLADMLKVLKP